MKPLKKISFKKFRKWVSNLEKENLDKASNFISITGLYFKIYSQRKVDLNEK